MNQSSKETAEPASLAFLAGGGEMGNRVRAFDWSRTPLGAVVEWPQSLRSALSICLNSSFPIAIYWGKDLTLLYNDDWSPIPGEKHPWALGRPAREVWSEIWDIIGPLLQQVVTTGQATRRRDELLPMHRHGYTEECYFDYTFSPVRGESGHVEGVFNAVLETTTRVIGERRLGTLRELAAWKTGEARSVQDACQTTAHLLAANPHDLPFALLYLIEDGGRRAIRGGLTALDQDTPASPAAVELDAPDAPWPFREAAEAGKAIEVADLSEKFGALPGGAWPESTHRAVVLPLTKAGHAQLAGFLVAGISPRLEFNDDYKGFVDLLAGHVASAIANASAYEEERRRAEALAVLDRAKTTFFSNVSHEFRTPLTLMLGPVEDMLARSYTELSPAATSQLEVVNRNGLRLLRLVNTLLDFSRIEAGRVRAVFQPTDLAAFTADLASVFRAAVERAGLRLVVDCPALKEPVFVDREMWEKIVLNLLSNAFKFTFDGEIAVSMRQVGDIAELRVRDTGTGVPAEEMPRLFERFHRIGNARGRTHEGTGIGLALVQELVKLHDGSITAESAVGRGTTFTVSIPLGSAHLPPDQIEEGRSLTSTGTGASPFVEEALRWLPDEGRDKGRNELPTYAEAMPTPYRRPMKEPGDDRPRVLVADDNADMRQYVVRLLAEHFRTEAVSDGEQALAAARERTPDLVLTDVMMPRLDGFGLLRELRADPRTRNVPVIMLSARAGEESRVEGMEAGADDYLVKPFSARELLARVTAHLQMARMRREASASLRQSEERLRMALNAGRMVAWQIDPATGAAVVSDNAADVFGLPSGFKLEDMEQGFALLHPEDRERHRATALKAVEECSSYRSHYRLVRPDNGAVQWMEERGHAICEAAGKAVQLVGVVMDITERKQAEEALREADRRKDEFLATLAHELRNPLAPIRNALQIIKLSPEREAREESRTILERQLAQLVRLIDDLMDVSRISRGKIELRREQVPLAAVVNSALETSRPLIEQMEHELKVTMPQAPIIVDADLTRLAQVFLNLLNNSAKYTERGGRIWLTAERQGSEAVVSVKDNGIGIAADQLPRLFEMFSQLDHGLERSQGGLGIGLTLVKRLVEMHGGRIEARSEGLGKGSEFIVRLPVVAVASRRQASSQEESAAVKSSLRILVVDDNRDGADSLAMMLQVMGNDTRTAYDGEEAVAAAVEYRPDVILLDIGLPKLNGYEACRRIREQPGGKELVIIAQTGWGQDEDRQRTHKAGFDHHLIKPVDPTALMNLLAGFQAVKE